MTVSCTAHPDCSKTWPRDPILEVDCPVCHAPVGVSCASVAPSGHRKSKLFSHLPPWGHDERDLAAVLAGAYGTCPSGRCGLQARADQLGITLEEMVELRRFELSGVDGIPGVGAQPPCLQQELFV